MKAHSLRFGNLVMLCFEHKPGWFISSVTDIYKDGTIDTDTTQLTGKQKYYWEPIPLTEEWLLKFGLDKDFVPPLDDEWFFNIQDNSRDTYVLKKSGTKILYVHQLQNLWHALTGEELKLNP